MTTQNPQLVTSEGERSFAAWEVIPAVAVALGGFLEIAYMDPRHWDLGLAYRGGVEAWRSGHPEWVRSWMSTPFLGMVMAIVSRVMTENTSVNVISVVNLGLVAMTVGLVWRELRGRVPRAWWWGSLTLALFFGPLISSLLYKQFNVIVFCLAFGGFVALRRGQVFLGSALIGLSICVKPLAVLLPVGLLARRDTRRAGILSLFAMLTFTALAQGFLAVRGHDMRILSPIPAIQNFALKGERWLFSQENFSPRGLLCRLATTRQEPALTRNLVSLVVAVLILAANQAIRSQSGTSWELFGFACLLSPMVGPIAWAHYQVLSLPMFLLLAYRFREEDAGWRRWAVLLSAYALSDLLQRPLDDSVPGALISLVTGRRETLEDIFAVMAVSQLGQYVLYGAALAWFGRALPAPKTSRGAFRRGGSLA